MTTAIQPLTAAQERAIETAANARSRTLGKPHRVRYAADGSWVCVEFLDAQGCVIQSHEVYARRDGQWIVARHIERDNSFESDDFSASFIRSNGGAPVHAFARRPDGFGADVVRYETAARALSASYRRQDGVQ